MRILIQLITALPLLVLLTGCSKLTMENYSKIKMGLEYPEVVKLLGKPDNCSEALFVRNCVWGNDQQNITVNFAGGQVILFASKNIK